MAGKAENGAGSVFFDKSKDRWRATYLDAAGKRRSVLGRTRAEAEQRALDAAEASARSTGGPLSPTMTIAELAEWWLTYVKAPDVRPPTLHAYRKSVARLVVELGDIPVARLTTDQVLQWRVSRLGHLSASTVRNDRTALHQIMATAVKHRLVPFNVVSEVRAPKQSSGASGTTKRTPTPEECRRIVEAARRHPLGAGVAMLFTLGGRASEVLGLAWSDIDLDRRTVIVQRGSTYTGGGIGQRLDEPKTQSTKGVREIAPVVVELLRTHRTTQVAQRLAVGPAWHTTTYQGVSLDMVFTTGDGRLVVRQRLYKAVQECCRIAGIDPTGIGTHAGRRAVITALYADGGVDLADVARHVGHASPTTTAGYVRHLGTRPHHTAELAARLLDPIVAERSR
ncbi:MAG: tyrosine-type recombinase/integrase [Acidimicrobiales bacterium]